jgi:hypothetical protein
VEWYDTFVVSIIVILMRLFSWAGWVEVAILFAIITSVWAAIENRRLKRKIAELLAGC